MSRVSLLPTLAFERYQQKRLANLRRLGPALRLDLWLQTCGANELAPQPTSGDWMAFHPWRPGWLPLDQAEAEVVRAGGAHERLDRLNWSDDEPPDLRGLCVRSILDFAALQNPWELERFLERVARRRPRVVVEIGTSTGGLLFAVAQLADPEATFISIDLPDPSDSPELRAAIPKVLASLVRPTQQLFAFRESSMVYGVREDVRGFLAGRAVDLLIIDGDHGYGAVRSDFELYAPLVGEGGLVAFHDVLLRPDNSGRGLDVGIFWQELVGKYATETIADPNGVPGIDAQRHTPFAARRPAALGWGLLER